MKSLTAILLILLIAAAAWAQGDFADPVSESALANISLPGGSFRVRPEKVPANITQMLGKVTEGNAALKQGSSEVIVLTGQNSGSVSLSKLRGQVENTLQNAGFVYDISGEENGITFFTAVRKTPSRLNIFGLWLVANGKLMLAMTEIFTGKPDSGDSSRTSIPNPAQTQNSTAGGQTFNLSESDAFVNLMGNKMPAFPAFPALPKKAGVLRGFVKDTAGNPLQGAYIGVRSTLNGGSYSGASATTDAKGYYEIKLPFGAIHLYAGAITADYGDLRAAMSLHPVDGRLDGFASADGDVENFVLLPYGIADRDAASEKPNGATNYYGGALRINYNLAEINNSYAPENYIRENSEIEITLAPEGALFDANAGSSFIIRKNVGSGMFFNIYNIPVGKYTLTARLVKGNKPLFMKQSVRNKNNSGITPKEAMGSASFIFEPDSAQPVMVKPAYGSWNPIDINLYLSK